MPPRLGALALRLVPRWAIEVALVAAAVPVYLKTRRLLEQPWAVRAPSPPRPHRPWIIAPAAQPPGLTRGREPPAETPRPRASRHDAHQGLLGVLGRGAPAPPPPPRPRRPPARPEARRRQGFRGAVWRGGGLRKRLLATDDAMDLARAAANAATAAVDKAAKELDEAQARTTAAKRELAASRLSVTEVQQALLRVEQEQRKQASEARRAAKRESAARRAGATQGSAGALPPATDLGDGVRLALHNFEQQMKTRGKARAGQSGRQSDRVKLLDDGRVDMRDAQSQQAFLESLGPVVAPVDGAAASGDASAASYRAAVTEVHFTAGGELARVGLDLSFEEGSDEPASGAVRDVE